MNIADRLRTKIRNSADLTPQVRGIWRPIQMCLDDNTGEFLNVGVMFSYGGKTQVRMMDSFERLRCLYDRRINTNELLYLLQDIEETIIQCHADLPDDLSENIRLGAPLYAAGLSPEAVVDSFFSHVVTLARPKSLESKTFRYQSSASLRELVLDRMSQALGLLASRIIVRGKYTLQLRTGGALDMSVPLLTTSAAGTIVSGWYKSPLVVENNILHAVADLNLIASNSGKSETALSILTPRKKSGLTDREFRVLDRVTHRGLERAAQSNIHIIAATEPEELAQHTIEWWRERAA